MNIQTGGAKTMSTKVIQALRWFEGKSKIPALDKARLNLLMKTDIISNPNGVPENSETLMKLMDAMIKILRPSDQEIQELKRILGL